MTFQAPEQIELSTCVQYKSGKWSKEHCEASETEDALGIKLNKFIYIKKTLENIIFKILQIKKFE